MKASKRALGSTMAWICTPLLAGLSGCPTARLPGDSNDSNQTDSGTMSDDDDVDDDDDDSVGSADDDDDVVVEVDFSASGEVIPDLTPADPDAELNAPWDWVGIIGTGQSLAVGNTPVLSKEQPYSNLKLALGDLDVPPYDPNSDELSMAPLIEPIRSAGSGFPRPYPINIWGETPHAAMANQLTSLVREATGRDYVTVHTVVGESGQGMSKLERGAVDDGETGRAYAATLFEVEAIARLADAAGYSFGIGAIVLTHGETDSGNSNYDAEVLQLWRDYNEDLKALTGQEESIPLIQTQQHAYPDTGGSSRTTLGQWTLSQDNPNDIVCAGPKYQYEGHGDGIHLSSTGYQQLGEKVGQVLYERLARGRDWRPLEPLEVTREENTIRVQFHVPVPPLTWNDDMPSPHPDQPWANGRGFEVRSGSTRFEIDSVSIDGDEVIIECAEDLPESGLFVGYAMITEGEPMPGGGANRWGHLKDSDPLVGFASGIPNPNYAVAFDLEVP